MARKKGRGDLLRSPTTDGVRVDSGLRVSIEREDGTAHFEPDLYTVTFHKVAKQKGRLPGPVEHVSAIREALREIIRNAMSPNGNEIVLADLGNGVEEVQVQDGGTEDEMHPVAEAACALDEICRLKKLTEQEANLFLAGVRAGISIEMHRVAPFERAARSGKRQAIRNPGNARRLTADDIKERVDFVNDHLVQQVKSHQRPKREDAYKAASLQFECTAGRIKQIYLHYMKQPNG